MNPVCVFDSICLFRTSKQKVVGSFISFYRAYTQSISIVSQHFWHKGIAAQAVLCYQYKLESISNVNCWRWLRSFKERAYLVCLYYFICTLSTHQFTTECTPPCATPVGNATWCLKYVILTTKQKHIIEVSESGSTKLVVAISTSQRSKLETNSSFGICFCHIHLFRGFRKIDIMSTFIFIGTFVKLSKRVWN